MQWAGFHSLARHRRNLVEKAAPRNLQIQEHLDAFPPAFTFLCADFWQTACAIAEGPMMVLFEEAALGSPGDCLPIDLILDSHVAVFSIPSRYQNKHLSKGLDHHVLVATADDLGIPPEGGTLSQPSIQ